MSLCYDSAMRTIASHEHTRHNPPYEILDGVVQPFFEAPRRVTMITTALAEAGFPAPESPRPFGLEPLLAVHSPAYVGYLEQAYAAWIAAGLPAEAVLPSAFVLPGLPSRGQHPIAQAGRYCFDLSAPITAGTFAAACAAADVALTAAELLLAGERAAYALCRPPGHHAAAAMAGGYCYLNHAAIAAQHLAATIAASTTPALTRPTVAVLDIDFHHGNGTQAIFYERCEVFFTSLHGDPAREYPYFLGYADEHGAAAGEGYNLNLPLPAGIDDCAYLVALHTALEAIAAHRPRYLVVSAGFDTFAGDPLGDFCLTTAAYARIGAAIAQLGLPTLFVQEGGYAIDELGHNLVSLLSGFTAEPGGVAQRSVDRGRQDRPA